MQAVAAGLYLFGYGFLFIFKKYTVLFLHPFTGGTGEQTVYFCFLITTQGYFTIPDQFTQFIPSLQAWCSIGKRYRIPFNLVYPELAEVIFISTGNFLLSKFA